MSNEPMPTSTPEAVPQTNEGASTPATGLLQGVNPGLVGQIGALCTTTASPSFSAVYNTLSATQGNMRLLVADVTNHSSGQAIDGLNTLWNGSGYVRKGLSQGGVYGDGVNALSVLDVLSTSLGGLSTQLESQISPLTAGLSAPWFPTEVNGLMSALETLNGDLLQAASSISGVVGSIPFSSFSSPCASGLSIGETSPTMLLPPISQGLNPSAKHIQPFDSGFIDPATDPPVTGNDGNGNEPPKDPPTKSDNNDSKPEDDASKSKKLFRRVNGKLRFLPDNIFRLSRLGPITGGLLNTLISGTINFVVPTIIVGPIVTTEEGIILSIVGGFAATMFGGLFDTPEVFFVATGASAITSVVGAEVIKAVGWGKKPLPSGDIEIQYDGNTYQMPPSQVPQFLQEHHLVQTVPTSTPTPAETVIISTATSGQHKGEIEIQYGGKAYYVPPSEVPDFLQKHHLATLAPVSTKTLTPTSTPVSTKTPTPTPMPTPTPVLAPVPVPVPVPPAG